MKDYNLIFDGSDLIGFGRDLRAYLLGLLGDFAKDGNTEDAREVLEMLEDLKDFENETGLLIISDNNGMGNTVRKY